MPTLSNMRNVLKSVLFVTLAVAPINCSPAALHRNVKSQRNPPIQSDVCEEYTHIPMVLVNLPTITRAVGHPHILFPNFGTNSYKYDGPIRFDGHMLQLESNMFEPFWIVKHSNRYIMILRDYFNKVDFEVRLSDGESPFEPIPFTRIPKQLEKLQFESKEATFAFQCWWLTWLAKEREWNVLCELLRAYLNGNSRSLCLGDFSSGWYLVKYRDFLVAIRTAPRVECIVEQLKRIMVASDAKDNVNGIYCVARAILALGGIDGQTWLCEFKTRALSMYPESDSRVQGLDFIPGISAEDCQSALQPSTKPSER